MRKNNHRRCLSCFCFFLSNLLLLWPKMYWNIFISFQLALILFVLGNVVEEDYIEDFDDSSSIELERNKAEQELKSFQHLIKNDKVIRDVEQFACQLLLIKMSSKCNLIISNNRRLLCLQVNNNNISTKKKL